MVVGCAEGCRVVLKTVEVVAVVVVVVQGLFDITVVLASVWVVLTEVVVLVVALVVNLVVKLLAASVVVETIADKHVVEDVVWVDDAKEVVDDAREVVDDAKEVVEDEGLKVVVEEPPTLKELPAHLFKMLLTCDTYDWPFIWLEKACDASHIATPPKLLLLETVEIVLSRRERSEM